MKVGASANPEMARPVRTWLEPGPPHAGRNPDDTGVVPGPVTIVDENGAAQRGRRAELPERGDGGATRSVAGVTENMPGGGATRPGGIVTALDGTTIEITDTDVEGRLVLADCRTHIRSLGVDRLVDVATLTGSVVTMFGGRYGALMSNDDDWAALVQRAGESGGDRVWRMPLQPWYATRIRGRYADIVNCRDDDEAGTIVAGMFLQRFAGDVPWAHVDALAWDLPHQQGLEGGAAHGVRLLVDVARAVAAQESPGGIDKVGGATASA